MRRAPTPQSPPLSVVLPALAVALAAAIPLVYLIVRAAGVGSEALEMAFGGRTAEIFWRTVALAGGVTLFSSVISLPLAWLSVATDLPARRAFTVLGALPLVFPSFVGGYVLLGALGQGGLLQGLTGWAWDGVYGYWGALAALTLVTYPYQYLAVRAALQRLDPALWESARVLGCSPAQAFARAVLPALRPALAAGGLLVALYTISDFGAVALLQYDSFSRAIYVQYQGAFDRSLAAVLSLVLVGLAVTLIAAEAALRGRSQAVRAGTLRPLAVPLGRWRGLAVGYFLLVGAVGVVLPLTVLGYWLLRSVSAPQASGMLALTLSSLGASGAGALLTVLAAAPVAILAGRYRAKGAGLIEGLSATGYALPPIVIALSLVFFGANWAPALYQTFAMLVFAYMVRFLPQAVGQLRAGLAQLSPHTEEAARSLGLGPTRTIWRVTLPLLRPSLLAAAALTFLTVMKELPLTLLLAPTGFKTLATQVWSASSEGYFADAALPALLLVAASALSLVVLLRGETGGRRGPRVSALPPETAGVSALPPAPKGAT